MKISLKKLTLLLALLISGSTFAQLEILIGRSQPIGGFTKKSGFEQAGYGKQGTCFQMNAMSEVGEFKMTLSAYGGLNKFNIDAYKPQFIEANKANGKAYTRFEVGKYGNFGLNFGPEYIIQVTDKIIVPIRAHVGFHIMMPPLKFKAYYTDQYSIYDSGESYDECSGSFVYEVLGLNFKLGTGIGYRLGDNYLLLRADYSNRFAGFGQMSYGSGDARATYPKKFTSLDFNIGFAFGLD